MAEGAALMLAATDRLLGDLADAVPALKAVGDALALVANGLGVEKVIVAVDDAALGRQVFCSGRLPLGEEGIGLCGPPGAWTQPVRSLDDAAARLLVRAVGVGVVRSTAPARVERAPQTPVVPVPVALPVATIDLTDAIAVAAARSLRYGWGFTLVLLNGGSGLANALRARMRVADTLIEVSDHELAMLLPETAGDRVPHVLSRLTATADVPAFSYGLACCPADGGDPDGLCRTAAARLEEARRAAAGQ